MHANVSARQQVVLVSTAIILYTCLVNGLDMMPCSPSQPEYFVEVISSMSTDSKDIHFDACLFHEPGDESQAKATSVLDIYEQKGEPDSHGWSRCQHCRLLNGSLSAVVDFETSEVVDLSWSHWAEQFQRLGNDQIHTQLVPKSYYNQSNQGGLPKVIINRPVYLLPLIEIHVGHILVDLVEQVYNSMILHYGEVRRDALIILDVAFGDTHDSLQHTLYRRTGGMARNNTIHSIIHSALTDLPLFSYLLFTELQLISQSTFEIIFSDLHIGLDISNTHYQLGYAYHPCLFNLGTGNSELLSLSERYQRFAAYTVNHARQVTTIPPTMVDRESLTVPSNTPVKITAIQRMNDRILLNLDTVADRVVVETGLELTVQSLENMAFSKQMRLFQETDIIVSIAGTALHNMLFMRPGVTAAVIIMQPGWCEWSWMYTNQAVLLGIRPFIYCDNDVGDGESEGDSDSDGGNETQQHRRHLQMSRRFWMQGPRITKANNVTLDIDRMALVLQQARDHVQAVRVPGMEYVHEEVMCPGQQQEQPQQQQPQQQPRQFPQQQEQRAYTVSPVTDTEVENTSAVFEEDKKRSVVNLRMLKFDVEVLGTNECHFSFALGIGIDSVWNQDIAILESMPHLSVCFQHGLAVNKSETLPTPSATSLAATTALDTEALLSDRLNDTQKAPPRTKSRSKMHFSSRVYCSKIHPQPGHSSVLLGFDNNLVNIVHYWAQVSTTGGRLRHSDLHHTVDCRQSDV